MPEFTTIKVYAKTRDRLAKEGKYNESMADILERIVNQCLKKSITTEDEDFH